MCYNPSGSICWPLFFPLALHEHCVCVLVHAFAAILAEYNDGRVCYNHVSSCTISSYLCRCLCHQWLSLCTGQEGRVSLRRDQVAKGSSRLQPLLTPNLQKTNRDNECFAFNWHTAFRSPWLALRIVQHEKARRFIKLPSAWQYWSIEGSRAVGDVSHGQTSAAVFAAVQLSMPQCSSWSRSRTPCSRLVCEAGRKRCLGSLQTDFKFSLTIFMIALKCKLLKVKCLIQQE